MAIIINQKTLEIRNNNRKNLGVNLWITWTSMLTLAAKQL